MSKEEVLHVRMLGERFAGIGRDANTGAAGDVIQDHGDINAVSDIAEMLDKPLLGGLIIIGRDHEDGVGTGGFCVFGCAQGVFGIVAADPGDHFHASVDGAHRHARHAR